MLKDTDQTQNKAQFTDAEEAGANPKTEHKAINGPAPPPSVQETAKRKLPDRLVRTNPGGGKRVYWCTNPGGRNAFIGVETRGGRKRVY